jgi:D-methionine transport system substrate-binding protein
MKKFLKALTISAAVLALAACGDDSSNGDAKDKIVVGASAGLHDVILEKAKPILEKEGIELEIEAYTDYVMPNQDLESGDLDANYFQHNPYLEGQIADHGYDIVSIGGIHVEPMGIYSNVHNSIADIPNGGTIIISNSVPEQGRILSLLESQGLIKLKDGVEKSKATLADIVENPKNLTIEADANPELLVTFFENKEGDAVVINANFVIDAGYNPSKDSLAIEGSDSDYVNVIAVRGEDKDNKSLKKLVEVLQSQEIQDFIKEEWDGNVVPTPTEK